MRFVIAAVAALFMTAPAVADSLKDSPAPARGWTGCHLGASVGYGIAQHDSTLDVVGAPISLNINSISGTGAMAGGSAGCDMQLGRFVFGLFGEYMGADLEHKTTAALGIASLQLSTTIESSFTLGARAGVLLTESTLGFVTVGYTRAETSDLHLSAGPLGSLSWDVPTLDGYSIGAGVEHRLGITGIDLALRAEYRHTEYGTASVALVPNALNLAMDTAEDSVRLGLVWRP